MRGLGGAIVALVAALGAPARVAAAPALADVVGLVAPADAAVARDLEDGATLALEAAVRAGHRPLRAVVRAVAATWGSAGSVTVALVRGDGAVVVVAPPDRGTAHEVVQVASKLGVPVLSLSRAPSVAGTGSPWCVAAVAPSGGDGDAAGPALPSPSCLFVAGFAMRFRRAPGPAAAEAFRAVTLVAAALARAPAGDARARRDALRDAVLTSDDAMAYDPLDASLRALVPW